MSRLIEAEPVQGLARLAAHLDAVARSFAEARSLSRRDPDAPWRRADLVWPELAEGPGD